MVFPLILPLLFSLLHPGPQGAGGGTPDPHRAGGDAADQVNSYIGTAGEGQIVPAAGVPFGMTQWTPQTRAGEQKCIAPYYYSDDRIQGFRGSHFLSGSCTQDYGSVTLMPVSGALRLGAAERSSAFARAEERPSPYNYAVRLADYDIEASVTGGSRAGLMRFRFDRPGESWVVVENNARPGEGTIAIDAERGEISGANPVHRLYAGAGRPAGFSGYFVIRFDHRMVRRGTWTARGGNADATAQSGVDDALGAYASFDLRPGEAVEARVGTSFTSVEEARRNLEAEIPGWEYSAVEGRARAAWDEALGRIELRGCDPDRRQIFLTALYHTMLLPREFSDAGGTYPGFAGEGRTETARGFTYYDDFSMWDTFRAVHPLLTILEPDRDRDMVRSLIAKGEEGGFMPIFPAWNSYTAEMVGDHAVALIEDAYAKGIRGFDAEEAYRILRHNALDQPRTYAEYADGRGRRALASYLKYGYIPLEDEVPEGFLHPREQVSRTLEYAYDDALIGRMAQELGHDEDAALFARRGQNYRNVIDPATGYARGRHADGSWVTPFDPAVPQPYITEGLPCQYTFFVPQDVDGLIGLLGGAGAFTARLDALFAGGCYDHGNEPSHHIAYLYDFAGEAWKTQMQVRRLLETKYLDRPDGLAGNDDGGQMSAWYVLSALGFYPVTPGVPRYSIGGPLFDEAVLHLPSGRQLRILAPGASQGRQYVHAVRLNGVPLDRAWITHEEITAGGELEFEMSAQPDPGWPAGAKSR